MEGKTSPLFSICNQLKFYTTIQNQFTLQINLLFTIVHVSKSSLEAVIMYFFHEWFKTGNNINSNFDIINQLFSNRNISNPKLETGHWIFFSVPPIIQIISKISACCYAWRFLKKSHHQNVCKTVSITIIKMDSRILNIIVVIFNQKQHFSPL